MFAGDKFAHAGAVGRTGAASFGSLAHAGRLNTAQSEDASAWSADVLVRSGSESRGWRSIGSPLEGQTCCGRDACPTLASIPEITQPPDGAAIRVLFQNLQRKEMGRILEDVFLMRPKLF